MVLLYSNKNEWWSMTKNTKHNAVTEEYVQRAVQNTADSLVCQMKLKNITNTNPSSDKTWKLFTHKRYTFLARQFLKKCPRKMK